MCYTNSLGTVLASLACVCRGSIKIRLYCQREASALKITRTGVTNGTDLYNYSHGDFCQPIYH